MANSRPTAALVAPLILAIGVFVGLTSTPAWGKSAGPPDGVAGNPPEFLDCSMCHFTYPVNSGPGQVEILGVPERFEPGAAYDLLVRVETEGQLQWGFELTVLDDTDPVLQGGQLEVLEPDRTQLSKGADGGIDYLKHTLVGTSLGSEFGSWSFRWTAPDAEVDRVTFYVAGNAADGNFDFTNDYIYTRGYPIQRDGAVPTLERSWGRVKHHFRPSTR